MKLRNWHIDGFGVFYDANLPEPGLGDGINLLVGPNEAGKSTLLDFLRYTLFGYPSGLALSRREPLRGGTHSGTVIYEKDSRTYRLFRKPGKRNAFDLRDPAENALTEAELKGHLGHLTADVFRKIFGFSLAELGEVDLLKSVGAGDLIFAASVGSSATRIRSVQDSLQKQADAIFKESSRAVGRNAPRLLKLHTELGLIEEQLVQAGEAARAVAGKLVLHEEKRKTLENVDNCLAKTDKDIPRLDKLIRGWPIWAERCQAEEEQKALGDPTGFPVSAEATWAALRTEFEKVREQAQSRSLEVAIIEGRLRNLPVEFTLLRSAKSAEVLATKRTGYDVSTQLALSAKNQEIESRQKWNVISEELGAEWTEEIVRNFDSSLLTEDEARRLTKNIRDAELSISAKRTFAISLARDARTLSRECVSQMKLLLVVLESGTVVSPEAIFQQRSSLAEFREASRERDMLQIELGRAEDYLAQVNLFVSQREPSEQQLPTWLIAVLMLGGLSLLAGAAGLIYLEERLAAGVCAAFGAALLALAALLRSVRTRGQHSDKVSESVSDAKNRYEVAKKGLQDHDDHWGLEAESTGFTWPVTENELAKWDGRIVAEERTSTQAEALSRDLEELKSKRRDKYHDFYRAKNEFDEAKHYYRKAVEDWISFLRARGLPETVQMETAISIFAKVKEARQHLKDCDEYQSRARERDKEAERYIEELLICLGDTNLTKANDSADTLVRFERFQQLIIEEQKQSRQRQERIQELNAAKKTLREAVRVARNARKKCQSFLNSLAVGNEEDFKALSERARRQLELDQTIREKNTALLAIFGPSGVPDELKQVSTSETLSGWEIAKARWESEKKNLSEKHDKTIQEMEALRLDIEKQLNSDEVARLQLEAEHLSEDIRKGIDDWLELASAQELLKQTRSKFERENQSPALEEASRLFHLITNHRYERIFIPLDSDETDLTILRSDGRTLSIDALSHGTLEQLYLSIRLGYIKQYQSQQDTRLPLMMDDVAVNFDPKRIARTFESLADCASRGQQIVFFTCHEELVKLLRPEDRCFRIRDFQFERQPIGPLIVD